MLWAAILALVSGNIFALYKNLAPKAECYVDSGFVWAETGEIKAETTSYVRYGSETLCGAYIHYPNQPKEWLLIFWYCPNSALMESRLIL